MSKKRIPKKVSEYFSTIGKKGYKAKVKKIMARAKAYAERPTQEAKQ
jgi:hypothetical protein